jgi:hypothetical protein
MHQLAGGGTLVAADADRHGGGPIRLGQPGYAVAHQDRCTVQRVSRSRPAMRAGPSRWATRSAHPSSTAMASTPSAVISARGLRRSGQRPTGTAASPEASSPAACARLSWAAGRAPAHAAAARQVLGGEPGHALVGGAAEKAPTIEVLPQIADGLGVSLARLVAEPGTDRVIVRHAHEQDTAEDPWSGCHTDLADGSRGSGASRNAQAITWLRLPAPSFCLMWST